MSFSFGQLRDDLLSSPRARNVVIVLFLLWAVGVSFLLVTEPLGVFVALPLTVVVLICAVYPQISIALIALSFPFIHVEARYGEWNVPIVDVIGMVALLGAFLRLIVAVARQHHRTRTIRLPGIWPFIAFIVAAAISVTNSWDPAASMKYLFRPIIFFYVTYVLLVVNSITTKRLLLQVLWILFGVGIVIALYGWVGLFVADFPSLLERRVVPFPLFGTYPLGANHNLIADVMVTTVPVGYFLLSQARTSLQKRSIFLGTVWILGAALLTFSRSAWLALCAELVLLFALYYRRNIRFMLRYIVIASLVVLPFVGYMVVFSSQEVVTTSTENRRILSDIGQEMAQEHPLFGAGAGTFISFVERNNVYMQEYGAPLDAHGFVMKVQSEIGIVGLVSFVALLASVLWIIYRAYARSVPPFYNALCISMLMMAAGSIFFQLFQTSYFISKLWFPLGVALAAAYQSEFRRVNPST